MQPEPAGGVLGAVGLAGGRGQVHPHQVRGPLGLLQVPVAEGLQEAQQRRPPVAEPVAALGQLAEPAQALGRRGGQAVGQGVDLVLAAAVPVADGVAAALGQGGLLGAGGAVGAERAQGGAADQELLGVVAGPEAAEPVGQAAVELESVLVGQDAAGAAEAVLEAAARGLLLAGDGAGPPAQLPVGLVRGDLAGGGHGDVAFLDRDSQTGQTRP